MPEEGGRYHKAMELGATRVAPNGYHYTKVVDPDSRDAKNKDDPNEPFWRLTHHIYAEKYLGRRLAPNERVSFRNGNKLDVSESNLIITTIGIPTINKKLAQLYAKKLDIEKEIAYWKAEADKKIDKSKPFFDM